MDDIEIGSTPLLEQAVKDLNTLRDNTICNCTTDYCTEDTCPCMNISCGDAEEQCEHPRGCLSECTCVRRPDENRGECDT